MVVDDGAALGIRLKPITMKSATGGQNEIDNALFHQRFQPAWPTT